MRSGARMKEQQVVLVGRHVEAMALVGQARIAGGGEHNDDGCSGTPADLLGGQFAVDTGAEKRGKVGVEEREDGLCFRVTEASIKLQDLKTGGGEHKTGIEYANEG
ncbi:MAG: hypothetical protein NVS2B7_25120 [Herpetosiphon sp.]